MKREYIYMKNYKITIQYDGTRYKGWQVQKSTDMTIQGKIQAVLSEMTGQEIEVIGSGRTDAGVHAYGQVANFHLPEHFSKEAVLEYLNHYLPMDIAVLNMEEVDERFHARYHATSKNYVYRNQLCCAGGFISDREVMEVCVEVINQILRDRELIQNTPEEQETVTPKYSELDNMVKRMGDEGYDKMSVLLLDRASERYLTLQVRDATERTQIMLEAIEDVTELEVFDEELYRKLIKEIIVNKDSTATVVFYNGSRLTTEYGQKEKAAIYIRKGVEDDS